MYQTLSAGPDSFRNTLYDKGSLSSRRWDSRSMATKDPSIETTDYVHMVLRWQLRLRRRPVKRKRSLYPISSPCWRRSKSLKRSVIRTLSRAVRRLTSRITASQSRAGLNPTPSLPISASDVSEAADLRILLLLLAIDFVGPLAPPSAPPSPLPSWLLLLAEPGSWVCESCIGF